MSDNLLRVSVDNKYTIVQENDGSLKALLHKEEWRDLTGDKLVLTLAQEVERLRKELQKARIKSQIPKLFQSRTAHNF